MHPLLTIDADALRPESMKEWPLGFMEKQTLGFLFGARVSSDMVKGTNPLGPGNEFRAEEKRPCGVRIPSGPS